MARQVKQVVPGIYVEQDLERIEITPERQIDPTSGPIIWTPGQPLPDRDIDIITRHAGKPIVLRPNRERKKLRWMVCIMRAEFRIMKLRTFHATRFGDAMAYAAVVLSMAEDINPASTLRIYGVHT